MVRERRSIVQLMPHEHNLLRDLVKAGALVVAEIERLQRASKCEELEGGR